MAYTPGAHALTHPSYSNCGSSYPYGGAGSTYNNYSHYPYSEPAYDDDYAGYNDMHCSTTPHSAYMTPRTTHSSYGGGAYDDMALNRHSSYYGSGDYDSHGAGVYGAASCTRHASSVSFHPSMSTGALVPSGAAASYYPGPGSTVPYGKGGTGSIKFRTRYSSVGMSLAEAVGGERPWAVTCTSGMSFTWTEMATSTCGLCLRGDEVTYIDGGQPVEKLDLVFIIDKQEPIKRKSVAGTGTIACNILCPISSTLTISIRKTWQTLSKMQRVHVETVLALASIDTPLQDEGSTINVKLSFSGILRTDEEEDARRRQNVDAAKVMADERPVTKLGKVCFLVDIIEPIREAMSELHPGIKGAFVAVGLLIKVCGMLGGSTVPSR